MKTVFGAFVFLVAFAGGVLADCAVPRDAGAQAAQVLALVNAERRRGLRPVRHW